MMSDVTVVGLAPGVVSFADIGVDVPHGVAVRVPADKALASKDLWRAIGQRSVMRLQGGPNPAVPVYVPTHPDETGKLLDQLGVLKAENAALREQLARKEHELLLERSKFDEILGLLRQGVPMAAPAAVASQAAPAHVPGVVEVEAPTFIPSTIKGDYTGARVEIEAAEGGSISDARSALRKLRRNE